MPNSRWSTKIVPPRWIRACRALDLGCPRSREATGPCPSLAAGTQAPPAARTLSLLILLGVVFAVPNLACAQTNLAIQVEVSEAAAGAPGTGRLITVRGHLEPRGKDDAALRDTGTRSTIDLDFSSSQVPMASLPSRAGKPQPVEITGYLDEAEKGRFVVVVIGAVALTP